MLGHKARETLGIFDLIVFLRHMLGMLPIVSFIGTGNMRLCFRFNHAMRVTKYTATFVLLLCEMQARKQFAVG